MLWFKYYKNFPIVVDTYRDYPYICNNAFIMRTEKYIKVIRHKTCCKNTDETTVNQYLEDETEPMCFLGNSFGIHPAWGSFGMQKKQELEIIAYEVVEQEFVVDPEKPNTMKT